MRLVVFVSVMITVISTALGFYLRSLGVGADQEGPAEIAQALGVSNALWPLIFPAGGSILMLFSLIMKRHGIRKLWRSPVGKGGVIIAATLLFGPALGLMLQSFAGLKHFELIDKTGMMIMLVILQLTFFFAFGNYVATAQRGLGGGFRTRWTKQNDIVWKKTQRFVGAGVVLVTALAFVSLFFAQPKAIIFAHIAAVIAVKGLATMYSYLLWRREKEERVYDPQ